MPRSDTPAHQMDLRDLHYFRILAEELNLGRASERIPISQPGLSAAIKRLEDECGVALFDRLPRGVKLTKAGEVLRTHADRVLAAHDSARRSLRALAAGEPTALRVGITRAVAPALFASVIAEVIRTRPGLRVELLDPGATGARQALLRGALDLGVVARQRRTTEHPDLVEIDLGEYPCVPMVRRDHPRLGSLNTPEALMQEQFVLCSHADGLCGGLEEQIRRLGLERPRIAATAPDPYTASELVAASDLVAVLPITVLPLTGVAPLVPLTGMSSLRMPLGLSILMRKDAAVPDATMLQTLMSARLLALRDAGESPRYSPGGAAVAAAG